MTRLSGLDTLRATAIILVFMAHFTWLTGQSPFGPFGKMGGMGVDLFFALSGYLIGHQIFSDLKRQNFSLKIFYARRVLRTLPNYFFVLALYLLFPFIREKPFTVPVWHFLTFTQNFVDGGPHAFSHAWSLCIEEQFYLFLPLILLFLFNKKLFRLGAWIVTFILISEIIIRGIIWLLYLRHAGENIGQLYSRLIYAPTFSRLDSLVIGVSLAGLKIYRNAFWEKITRNGNLILCLGIIGYVAVAYIFQTGSPREFLTASLNYSFLALTSNLLVLSALSQNSLLNRFTIPGATILATWSYAIYLTHKSLIHITQTILIKAHLTPTYLLLPLTIFISILGGWLLYIIVEKPFLKLRDKFFKNVVTIAPTSIRYSHKQSA